MELAATLYAMKHLFLVILGAAALTAGDPYGDWYGTLVTPNGSLRLALHITKPDTGARMTMDSIDQGASGIAAAEATVVGNKVSGEWPNMRGKLSGEVNEAGSELNATWSQSGRDLPLKLTREKFVIREVAAVPITAAERDFLVSHLEMSRREFLKSIQGLSKEQWNFKPSADRWSIAECAEHLNTTEDALFNLVTQQLLRAPTRDVTRKTRADDEKVLASITDRSKKGKAPEMLVPSGKFDSAEAVEKAFGPKRDRSIEFVRTTQEDLRGRVSGAMDAYQYLVMMSGHTLRHTAQLNEVKTDPKYPK